MVRVLESPYLLYKSCDSLQKVRGKYETVLNEGVGKLQGYVTKLIVKENAVPIAVVQFDLYLPLEKTFRRSLRN